jgi:hypothetical protein
MQGRSLPRAFTVYADFAAVIGTAKPGRWIADCCVETFAAELAACTGTDPATFAFPDDPSRRGHPRVAGLFGGTATLAGMFAAYSPAWSPHFRGRLLRGMLRLAPAKSGALIATYTESVVGRDVHLTGEAWIGGRMMHFVAREPEGDMPLFISLHVPGPPASVLCGIMSGVAFVANETLPSASPILFIRVPDTPRLGTTNRYLDPIGGAIAADLADLGVNIAEADRLDSFVLEFLGINPCQVTTQHQATFAGMLDREHLDVAR